MMKSCSNNQENAPKHDSEVELTLQYLDGKVTFQEYSDALLTDVKEEVFSDMDDDDQSQSSNQNFDFISSKLPENKTSKVRFRKKLPKVFEGLMGEANIRYASGQHEEAISICMEIIRNCSTVPDPFHLLAIIYEEMGLKEKSIQYSLVAVHLRQLDLDEWIRVADKCLEIENGGTQALYCYAKACKLAPKIEKLWMDRCHLMEREGVEEKKILDCYRHWIASIPEKDGDRYMEMARELYNRYHSLGETDKVIEIIITALKKHKNKITDSDINLLLELTIAKCNYKESLNIIIELFGEKLSEDSIMDFEKNITENISNSASTNNISIDMIERMVNNSEMQVDLKAKLGVCLIHLGDKPGANLCLEVILKENPELVGDLYLDLAEAYVSEGMHEKAKPLFQKLTLSNNYNLAGVWLRYAECLSALRQREGALQAYENVVNLAPNHREARITLSALYQQMGNFDKALEILKIDDADTLKLVSLPKGSRNPTASDVRLMLTECSLLYKQGKFQQFVFLATKLLTICCLEVKTERYKHVLVNTRQFRSKVNQYNFVVQNYLNTFAPINLSLSEDLKIDLWQILMKLFEVLVQLKSYETLYKVNLLTIVCPAFFFDKSKFSELNIICVAAGLLTRNTLFAYGVIRELILRDPPAYNNCWNVLCQMITSSHDTRHDRFCLRLAVKYPDCQALALMNGNNALVSGSYKNGLAEYFTCLRKDPDNPLYHMLIAICYISMLSQKYVNNRHQLASQAFAFLLQYKELRGECQESLYNIGRALHQIGFLTQAAWYYQRALDIGSCINSNENDSYSTNINNNDKRNSNEEFENFDTNSIGRDNVNTHLGQSTDSICNDKLKECLGNMCNDVEKLESFSENTSMSKANGISANQNDKSGLSEFDCVEEQATNLSESTNDSSLKKRKFNEIEMNDFTEYNNPLKKSKDIRTDNSNNCKNSYDNNIQSKNNNSEINKQNFELINNNSREKEQKSLKNIPEHGIRNSTNIFDLSHEIAYNLYIIYLHSGSSELASKVLQDYLII